MRPLSFSSSPHRFSAALLRRLDGVWVELTPDLARQLAQKSTAGIAATIRQQRERVAERVEAMAYHRMAQALLIEERDAERRNRALWRRVKVKTPKEAAPERRQHRPTRSGFLAGASPLPSYSGAIVDRLGRRSVFLRIRYYGRKTTRPGVGRRVAIYIYEGAALNADGALCLFSNVAQTPEEAIAAMELLEQVNREAAVDAKLLFHLIANLPHQLTIEQMREEARRFAEEQFGSRDLPYVVALHPPSPDGDQRNWHLHILASTRPMRRVGNHEWELGQQLRTEIDNPEAFRRMRELYAAIQTEVAQEAGLNLIYTALSNAARGLPIKPQEHLGGRLTDMVRRGETVAMAERNRETVVAGERAMLDERLRHEQEAATRQAALVGRALAGFVRAIGAPIRANAVKRSQPIRTASSRAAVDRKAMAKVADRQVMPTGVPISAAVSNLKHAMPHPAAGTEWTRSITSMRVLPEELLPSNSEPIAPGSLFAVRDAPVLAMTDRKSVALTPPRSAAVSNLKQGSTVSNVLQPSTWTPSSIPDGVEANQSRLTAAANLGIVDVPVDVSVVTPLPSTTSPSSLLGQMVATLTSAAPILTTHASGSAALPRLPGASSMLVLPSGSASDSARSHTVATVVDAANEGRQPELLAAMARQAAIASRNVDLPVIAPKGPSSVGPELSSTLAVSRPIVADVERATTPGEARMPDDGIATVRLLIRRRAADLSRRKAERERRAAAAAAAAAAQAAALAAEQADLERLRRLDPLVNEFLRKGLAVADEVLVALGRDADWERTPPVQRVLAEMLRDQNERLDRLEIAPDGTPPVSIVGDRLVPAGHLAPDLARSVERWSKDASFRAMAAAMWPAQSPSSMEPAVRSSPGPARATASPQPATASADDKIERARRWAAAYRERLMLSSDATERWDRDRLAGRSGEELAQGEQPPRKPVDLAARSFARHSFDPGRGG